MQARAGYALPPCPPGTSPTFRLYFVHCIKCWETFCKLYFFQIRAAQSELLGGPPQLLADLAHLVVLKEPGDLPLGRQIVRLSKSLTFAPQCRPIFRTQFCRICLGHIFDCPNVPSIISPVLRMLLMSSTKLSTTICVSTKRKATCSCYGRTQKPTNSDLPPKFCIYFACNSRTAELLTREPIKM